MKYKTFFFSLSLAGAVAIALQRRLRAAIEAAKPMRFGLLFVIGSCFQMLTLAQTPSEVLSTLAVSRIVLMADGKEISESAATAKPGDILEYIVEYRNGGKTTARQLEATLPIPSGTEFLPEWAKPAGAMASLDGAKFEPIPLKRKVKQADGKLVEQLIPYVEYRYLRWPAQDLAAGKNTRYIARTKVSASVPAGTDAKK